MLHDSCERNLEISPSPIAAILPHGSTAVPEVQLLMEEERVEKESAREWLERSLALVAHLRPAS